MNHEHYPNAMPASVHATQIYHAGAFPSGLGLHGWGEGGGELAFRPGDVLKENNNKKDVSALLGSSRARDTGGAVDPDVVLKPHAHL
jgi:hypothetical protein